MAQLLIVATLAIMLIVRFFTETLDVLPRHLNVVEMGLIPLAAIGLLFTRSWFRTAGLGKWLLLFLAVCAISSVLNIDRMSLPTGVLFVAGHVIPILFGLAVLNAKPLNRMLKRGRRAFFVLGAILVFVTVAQIPSALDSPDALVGTFGENSNQTALFLSFFLSLLLADLYCREFRMWRLVVVALLFGLFFLAGFKALWVFFPLAIFLTLMTQLHIRTAIIVRSIAAVVVPVLAFIVVINVVKLHELEYFTFFERFDPEQFGKIQITLTLPQIWAEEPLSFFFGTGPGTFTSRAFRTFAALPTDPSIPWNWHSDYGDVTAGIVERSYLPEVTQRYMVPIWSKPNWQLGSGTTDSPWTSYISLLAETGVFGFVAILTIYLATWWRMVRYAREASSVEARSLALAASLSLLILLFVSTLDNYLEHTRLASIVWFQVGLAWAAMLQAGMAPVPAPVPGRPPRPVTASALAAES